MPVTQPNIGVTATIPAGAVNHPLTFSFDLSKLVAFSLYTDQNVTLYTNNPGGSGPTDTISLPGKKVTQWSVEGQHPSGPQPFFNLPASNPFSASVTGIFVSNPGASDAIFRLAAQVDP